MSLQKAIRRSVNDLGGPPPLHSSLGNYFYYHTKLSDLVANGIPVRFQATSRIATPKPKIKYRRWLFVVRLNRNI